MSDDEPAHAYRIVARDRPVQSVIDMCRQAKWPLAHMEEADPQTRAPFVLGFEDRQTQTFIDWVDDEVADFTYLALHGPAAERLVERVRAQLACPTLDDLFAAEEAATTPLQRMNALMEIGVAAPPELHGPTFERIGARLTDAHPSVRATATVAVRYRPWVAYRGVIERALAAEEDVHVRGDLERLLADFDEIAIAEPA